MHRAPSRRPIRAALAIAVLALAIMTPATAAYAATESSHTGQAAPAATHAAPAAARATYTVRAGDWLAGIAKRSCGNVAGWPAIYAANRATIGANPDQIYPGQRLILACGSKTPSSSVTTPPRSSWALPLRSYSLTSCYGMRWGALHRGIDMAARSGTPIRAANAGVVKVAGWHWHGYGLEVVIAHAGGIWTHYAHQSRLAVRVGQRVAVGQVIGYVGATGDATGPHLHFEVMRSSAYGSQINPAPFLRSRGLRIGC